jgi:hypothetical protein
MRGIYPMWFEIGYLILWIVSIICAKRFKYYIEPIGLYEMKDGMVIGILFGTGLTVIMFGIAGGWIQ